MQKVKKHKNIYLSGGGNESQSFSLDKLFFDKIPKNGNYLYIPIALRGHKLFPTANEWMGHIIKLHNRTDLNFITLNDLNNYNLDNLLEFDAIYIGGGNTWNLMSEINTSGFSKLLIEYIDRGGSIYGGSAGAIILGDQINTHNDPNDIKYVSHDGLGKINGYSVACHYNDEQSEQFKNWSIDNKLPIICLPEETGLVIDDETALCVGTKPCTIFLDDGSCVQHEPNQKFGI